MLDSVVHDHKLDQARVIALARLIPATQFFSIVDVAFLLVYFWSGQYGTFLVTWAVAVVVSCVFWWWVAVRAQRGRPADHGFDRWWVPVHAVVEALLFGIFVMVMFPRMPGPQATVLAAFITGLMAAGTLSKMTHPLAAGIFGSVLSLLTGLGLILSDLPSTPVVLGLLGAFDAALIMISGQMSRTFVARFEAEQEVIRQKALVADLLEDFSASSSDALWETDGRGLLVAVSARLAELCQVAATDLVGRPLLPGHDGTPFASGKAFRNLEVAVRTHGGNRWWSITGKPLRQGDAVAGWRGVATDITESRGKELEVLRLSRHDHLTGLLNRTAFREQIEEVFGSPKAGLKVLALLDIERFKDVNETRGHAFGDALLMAVAERLQKLLPPGLSLARLDGDEFGIQGVSDASREILLRDIEELLARFAEPMPVLGDRFEARFRLGLAIADASVESAQEWLRYADLALRVAKQPGNNHVQVYEASMSEAFHARNRLRAAVGQALARNEISLAFQPIFELTDRRLTGFEALVRWRHPEFGPVSPATFIPLAEETDVIQALGLWVLEEACRTALQWPEDVYVSVNVSGVQLRSASWEAQVREVLGRVGLDPRRLVLEVTESALVRGAALARTFRDLKSLGVRWALDDFGTGYSALSYLQDFPFDKLKIDQSFVRNAEPGEVSGKLLYMIIALSRTLGMSTVAEGIEDQEHLDLLRGQGPMEGQGYYFSRPIPAVDLGRFLEAPEV